MARGIRWGVRLGTSPALADSLWESLTDAYAGCSMGETAENLATRYKLDRGCADEFALRSQQLTAAASFADEIVPVPVKGKSFDKDEHPRPDTTLEGLGKLKPVFREGGVVTAGNASGIGDGAAALVIASDTFAKSRGLKPLARLVSWGLAGVDPTIMGIGPVPAAQIALKRAGRSLSDIDLIEINEAFAAQTCAVERELQIPREKLNVHGGAIALSHPLAASGARITTHLIYALRRAGKRWGLGAACIGGGQGIAVVIESLS
jgi:acetyl-CoA acetyltransferase family protein